MRSWKWKDRGVNSVWWVTAWVAVVTTALAADRVVPSSERPPQSTAAATAKPDPVVPDAAEAGGAIEAGQPPAGSAPPPDGDRPGTDGADESGEAAAAPAAESPKTVQQRLLRRLTAGLLVLVAVGLVGLFLVLLAMLWGRRVRRVAKQALPSSGPPAPLWFLRPRSAAGENAAAEEGDAPEGSSGHSGPEERG